mgnify:CR=1 FL=1
MFTYLVRRFLMALLTIVAISALAFIIIEIPPGNQLELYIFIFDSDNMFPPDPEIVESLRRYLGLDKPQYIRYLMWVGNLLQGDLGLSFQLRQSIDMPIKEIIGDRLWLTVALSGFTIMVTWMLAIPIGIYSAVRHHSIGDYAFTFIGFAGLAVPDFLLGLVLMYVAYAYFDQSVGGLFSSDYVDLPWSFAKTRDLVAHLWIPAIVLGTSGTASLIRILRNNLLDELGKPYVATALSKGVSNLRVILKYPVRVAFNPLISTMAYLLPALINGSIIVSLVLSLPTLGPVLLEAIEVEDVGLAGVIILMSGALTVVGTFLSDIVLGIVDPRIKYTSE